MTGNPIAWLRAPLRRVSSQVVADVSSTLVGNAYGAGVAFAAGAVLAHWLGPERRGVVELGLFAANAGTLLLGLGMNVPTTVFVAKDPPRGWWAFRTGVTVTVASMLLGGLVLALPYVGLYSRLTGETGLVTSVIAVFGGLQLMQLANGLLVGLGHIHRQNIVVAVRWTIYFVFLLTLTALSLPRPFLALGAYAAGPLIAAVFAWRFVPRTLRPPSLAGRLAPRQRWEVLWFGLRAQFANVFQFASYRFDVLLVGLWVGKGGLGVYAVGVMFAEALWLLPNAAGTVLLSHTSRFSREESDRRIGSVFGVVAGLVVLGALALGGLAVAVTRLYLGPKYGGVPAVTWLLLPGAVALSGTKILSNDLVARGFPGINTAIAFVGAITTLAADVLLIPRAGILGASVASSIGYSASFVMTLNAFRKRVPNTLWGFSQSQP